MDTPTLSAYEKLKPAIYRWRKNYKEKFNDICSKAQAIYYEKNKDRISKWKKEWSDVKTALEYVKK